MPDQDPARELETLAAELESLATFAKRAPTETGRDLFTTQADGFAQRANALGYPSIADGIGIAKKSATWHGVADALDLVAVRARELAGLASDLIAPLLGESINVDARAAHSDAWEAFHRHGGPCPLDSRTTGETVPADCTGYIDEGGHLAHDGATCPVHESGDVDRGDEREHAETDAETFAALGSDAVMLDQLASLARTALEDAAAVGLVDPFTIESPGPRVLAMRQNDVYAVTQLDLIINTLNPAAMDAAGAAGAFAVLGRHIEDVRDRLEAEDVIEKERSLIGDAIAAALDHLDQAIGALKGGDDVAA